MTIYLEANVTIYLVERVQPYLPRIEAHTSAPNVNLVVSGLTRLESRVHPMMHNDPARLAQFDAFFATVRVVDIPVVAFDLATTIRATLGFKTADSIHLAAAVTAGCDVFLTNDHQLKKYTGLHVEVI